MEVLCYNNLNFFGLAAEKSLYLKNTTICQQPNQNAPQAPSCFICQTHKGSARLPGKHFGFAADKSLLTSPGRANYSYPAPRKCPNFCEAAVFEFASEVISK